ncbi:DUF3046 domain-containing protein [Saccharothrix violaceirubra]|uniref:DUF3046 family protein n=1 Tax=Saccharothrix violaceirubra TaxID=413306 RepID=A0A7W7WXQ2_9PSEU|nr:DUF3046 domain-containing protein [Saccharothrix violaceirubra]MBB4967684.1 hypothetical protein [Saccharothrix violaceirubra]
MRNTVFRKLMANEFGQVRAELMASDHVLSALGGRTPDQALDEGIPAKEIWVAVCDAFEVPEHRR